MNDEPREDMQGGNINEPDRQTPLAKPLEPAALNLRPPTTLTGLRAFAEILFVLAFLAVPTLVRRILSGGSTMDQAREYGTFLYVIVLIQGLLVILAIAMVLFYDHHPWRSVGLHFRNLGGEVVSAIAALVAIYALQGLISVLVYYMFPEFTKEIEKHRFDVVGMFPRIPIPVLALFTLFVGLYEELLFRGFLMTRLQKIFRNFSVVLVISSVLFAVVHAYQDYLAMFQIFTVAMVIGALFIIRRSLISPILVHAMFDFISLSVAFYYFKK